MLPKYQMPVAASITLIGVSSQTFEQAGRLDPPVLRSLDALHLACALELGDDLDGLVSYDDRLTEAAHANGVTTSAPS